MNSCGPETVRDIALSVSEDGIVGLRRDYAVKIVVGDDLHVDGLTVGELGGDGRDVVAAVRPAAAHARLFNGNATGHDVVDVASRAGGNEIGEALIHLRRAARWNGDVARSENRAYGESNDEQSDVANRGFHLAPSFMDGRVDLTIVSVRDFAIGKTGWRLRWAGCYGEAKCRL